MITIVFSYTNKRIKDDNGEWRDVLSNVDFKIIDTEHKYNNNLNYEDRNIMLNNIAVVKELVQKSLNKEIELQIVTVSYSNTWVDVLSSILKLDIKVLNQLRVINMLPVLDFLDPNPIAYRYEKLYAKYNRLSKTNTFSEDSPNIDVILSIISFLSEVKYKYVLQKL